MSTVHGHEIIDQRSLAFDRATIAKIASQPELIDRALATLQRWLPASSLGTRPTLLEWQTILIGPREELLDLLSATDERATRLRQSSPFAGIFTASERTAILRQYSLHDSPPA